MARILIPIICLVTMVICEIFMVTIIERRIVAAVLTLLLIGQLILKMKSEK